MTNFSRHAFSLAAALALLAGLVGAFVVQAPYRPPAEKEEVVYVAPPCIHPKAANDPRYCMDLFVP